MAKYTELFGEYLQNNTLPNIFDEIENFKSLFILKYIDSEIGFETEYLFTQKLLLYANLYIPEYKKRIEALKNVENTLFNKLQLVDDVKDIKHQVSIDEYMYNKNKGKRLVKR